MACRACNRLQRSCAPGCQFMDPANVILAIPCHMRSLTTQSSTQGSTTTLDRGLPTLSPSYILQLIFALRSTFRPPPVSTLLTADLRHQLCHPRFKQPPRGLQHEHVGAPYPTSDQNRPTPQRPIQWDLASLSPLVCAVPGQTSLSFRKRQRRFRPRLPHKRPDDARLEPHILRFRHHTTNRSLPRRRHQRPSRCLRIRQPSLHPRCKTVSTITQDARRGGGARYTRTPRKSDHGRTHPAGRTVPKRALRSMAPLLPLLPLPTERRIRNRPTPPHGPHIPRLCKCYSCSYYSSPPFFDCLCLTLFMHRHSFNSPHGWSTQTAPSIPPNLST